MRETPREELLPCVRIEPEGPARLAVIWLHGLGADGHDFEPIVPHLGLGDRPVRFLFPHAPSIPVTLNAGFVMPAWYDISDLSLDRRHDEGGIRRSAERVEALLRDQIRQGIPARRIVLAGFSQGGAVALHLGLRFPERLAGLLALSTYLVLPESLRTERSDANRDLPIFQGHGVHDPMVAVQRGETAREFLTSLGYGVEFHRYPMQHEVCMEEIADVGRWLRARLDESAAGSAAGS
jgi:phospholipase/carboxylesterase